MADGRAGDPDRVPGALRLLYGAMGVAGLGVQFLITAGWLMQAAIVLGAGALLYMAVSGRAPDWWEK